MADTSNTTTDVHFLAIDVAKQWNAVLIETATGTKHRFKMANSAQDFERLIELIQNLGGQCRAAIEPTGDYHRPIAHRLLMAGVDLVSVSSVAQARYREAKFHSWNKNDPKDASVILDMLKHGIVQQYVDPMIDLASKRRTADVYNLLNGSDDEREERTEPSVHRGIQRRSGTTGQLRRA